MKRYILTSGIQTFLKPDDGGGSGGSGGEGEHIHEQEGDEGKESQQVSVDKSERFAKFREQFSVSKNAPVDQGGKPGNKPSQEAVDQARADTERIARERAEQKRQAEQSGEKIRENTNRPGSNVPKNVEAKRKAELERDDFKTKVEKYEQTEKPAFEAKISELQAKIDEGVSAKKEAELTGKITELETQMREKEDSLVNENQNLKKRLAFYNLAEDPDFKEKFEKPVVEAYNEAFETLSDDKQRGLLRQAIALNAQYLRSTDKAERAQIRNDRDSILTAVQEDLKGFAGQNFFGAMMRYIKGSEVHAQALQDHEATTHSIREKAQEQANKARAERLASWDKTFKVTAQQYDEDAKFTDDEKTILKDLKLDVDNDLKAAELLASNVVIGKSKMEDAIDMIHKGRVYPAMKAKMKVLAKQIADRDAIIAKLRGSGPSGGDTSQNGGEGSGSRKPEKQSREEWQRQFSANRK